MWYKIIEGVLVSSLIFCSCLNTATAETSTMVPEVRGDFYLSCIEEEETEKGETEEELATQYEKDLIAIVTMGEAEGECEEGKRLVIDTILNRVDSEHFPNTIEEVVYQPGAFEAMWNGRVNKSYDMTGIYEMIDEELENRTNSDVVFFTAGQYGAYGKPLFSVGNHYFASYE